MDEEPAADAPSGDAPAAPGGDPSGAPPVEVDVPVDVDVQEAVPDEVAPDADSGAVPDLFFWALWIGVFAVLLWGMMVLFRGRAPDDR